MIRLGRVYSNLMIDMPATNEKLRRRAVEQFRERLVESAGHPPDESVLLRDDAGHGLKAIIEAYLDEQGVTYDDVGVDSPDANRPVRIDALVAVDRLLKDGAGQLRVSYDPDSPLIGIGRPVLIR